MELKHYKKKLTGSRMETKELNNLRPKCKCGQLVTAHLNTTSTISILEFKNNRKEQERLTYLSLMKKDSSKQTISSSSSSFLSMSYYFSCFCSGALPVLNEGFACVLFYLCVESSLGLGLGLYQSMFSVGSC